MKGALNHCATTPSRSYLMMCFQQSSACDPSSKASSMTSSMARTDDRLTLGEAENPPFFPAPAAAVEQSSCVRGDRTSPTLSCSSNLLQRRVAARRHLQRD